MEFVACIEATWDLIMYAYETFTKMVENSAMSRDRGKTTGVKIKEIGAYASGRSNVQYNERAVMRSV
jgi:hypothetical protein